jgi:hypothetical protein
MPKNEASHGNLTTLFLLRKPEASTIKVKAISLQKRVGMPKNGAFKN